MSITHYGVPDMSINEIGLECACFIQEFLVRKAKVNVGLSVTSRDLQVDDGKAKNHNSFYLQASDCVSCQQELIVPTGSFRAAVTEKDEGTSNETQLQQTLKIIDR